MKKMLVFGDEPFQIDKYRKELHKKVEVPELDLLETNEFTENEKQFLGQYSLFGNEKILIYRAGNLKDCAELVDYVAKRKNTVSIYVFCNDVDKRSKVYKAFKKDEIKEFNKLSHELLEKTIVQYVKMNGSAITKEAYNTFLQYVNYYSEESNLYDVLHALERLCVSKEITKETVEKVVLDRETEDIYSLIQLISERNHEKAQHQADLILQNQKNNVIGVLSLLLRSYRLAYKMRVCNVSLKEIGVQYRTFVPRLSAEECHKAMNVIDEAVNKIKQGFYRPEIALKLTLVQLCNLKEV